MRELVARQQRDGLNARRRNLLDTITARGGVWKAGDVMRLYRANGWGCCRSTARHDLQFLARQGLLVEHGADNDRRYTAVTR
jgi:Fe2+ or Zn2+ uptake regulation protein